MDTSRPASYKWPTRPTVWALVLGCLAFFFDASAQPALAPAAPDAREPRVALVIGNAAYKDSPLRNPVNDATDVSAALTRLGFRVILRTNVNRAQMRAAVRDFGLALRAGGVGLFYYAGHGVESKGRNFLIPLAANLGGEFELDDEAVDANSILRAMEDAGNPTNIMILDACRDNPFSRSWRSAARGLAQMNAPTGSFVAFATAPGAVAADGTGRNGVFTKHLLASLAQPDLDIDRVFTRITAAVAQETAKRQVPWKSSSLTGAFSFAPGAPAATLDAATGTPAAPADPSANDRAFWESVKDSREPEELKAYLAQFPQGLFAALAASRLKALEATPVAAAAPSPAPDRSDSGQAGEEAYNRGLQLANVNNPNRNDVEAARLFRLAGNQRHAGALAELGGLHIVGRGVPKDDIEAVRFFRLAAEQGEHRGQFGLAGMYANGRGGLPKDLVEAARLFRLSASQGYAPAQTSLGFMHLNGLGGVARDHAEAARMFRLAAQQGHAIAQHNLGMMYDSGMGGLAKDEVEAVRLLRLAAEQGEAGALFNLGLMYEQGKGGLAKDLAAAKSWYQLSARKDNSHAKSALRRLGASW